MKIKRCSVIFNFILILVISTNMVRTTAFYDHYPASISINGESDVVQLDPGEYVHVHHYVMSVIVFSFQCDNPNVRVTGFLMDDDYFESFQHGGGYAAFYLSDGPQNSASGRYEVHYEDYWNIVFINDESNEESTLFHYSLLFDNEDPFLYITPILAILLVVGVILWLFLIHRIKPRESIEVFPD